MLCETVNANEDTDVGSVVASLREKALAAGLDATTADLIASEVQGVLAPLVESGKKLAAIGSQMSVTRDIRGDGYSIRLSFGANVPQSFFGKMLGVFGKR